MYTVGSPTMRSAAWEEFVSSTPTLSVSPRSFSTTSARSRDETREKLDSDLAIAAAEKLVRRTLREEDHRRIVTEAIAVMKTS